MLSDAPDKKVGSAYLLTILIAAAVGLFGTGWYATQQPMNFLESGYPVWKAKQSLLASCDLGSTAVFGDSQADSAFVPTVMPGQATNLGFAGGTPIDAYFFVRKGIACNKHPPRLMLSFGAEAFTHIQPWLWDNAVRYGYLGRPELDEVRTTAQAIGDPSFERVTTRVGFKGRLRDTLYATHFPAIYFSSLVEGRIFQRRHSNDKKLGEVLAQRGYPNYGRGGAAVPKPLPASFAPLPLQVYFFEKTLATLEQAGIPIDFVLTPVSAARMQAGVSPMLAGYLSYLRDVASRHPNFHVVQDAVPVWQPEQFTDGMHLNDNGARAFSMHLGRCLQTSQSGAAVAGIDNTCGFTPARIASNVAASPY